MEPELKNAIETGRAVPVRPFARALSMSPVCVYSAIKRGEIRSIRIGDAIRIPNAEARRLLGLTEVA